MLYSASSFSSLSSSLYILEPLPVLGLQLQGRLGVFEVVVGEVPHQSAGEGRQSRHAGALVLRQEFAEDGGRVLELCAHGVPVPELEDAVLAGDLQCWVEAQEGIAAPAGAVGGGLQQEAVSAFGPENPQGLDWSDEVGEELPADGDIAAAAGCRQLTGFLQGWIVHRRSSFRGRAKQKHPPSTTMSQGRAKISLAVPPCFTA